VEEAAKAGMLAASASLQQELLRVQEALAKVTSQNPNREPLRIKAMHMLGPLP
jgi:hypothetical protein